MAVKIDAKTWRKRRGMAQLLKALGADQGLTRYVGGAVRDSLLKLPVSDVDLATRIRPAGVVERLEAAGIKAVPTGIDHGTVTAVSEGQPYEVTTLRRDLETDGRRATVAFTDEWREDAARRDFTINALFADPTTGEIFDYFDGLRDLKRHRVRFIGDPFQRIAEDHLRILRFFRFHARFGHGTPDPAGLEACAARAKDLMALSRERIADELLKLLAVAAPTPTVKVMLERSILKPVIPEIGTDAWKALQQVVEAEDRAAISPDAVRRLASLLPDDPGAAEAVAVRLKLSNKARKRIACAAGSSSAGDVRALAYHKGTECAVDRLLLSGCAAAAAQVAGWTPPRLPIGGGELIRRGVPEGPAVSRALRLIEERWVAAGFPGGESFEAMLAEVVSQTRR